MRDIPQTKHTNQNAPAFSIWAIVPAKPLEQAKSRLADILTVQERRNLAYHLFQHTLQVLVTLQKSIPQLQILIVSSDETLLAESHHQKMQTLFETTLADTTDSNTRLNLALSQAAKWCYQQDPEAALLILPTDLPLLKVEDLLTLFNIAASRGQPKFVINPDSSNTGTNALLLQPPDLLHFDFCFGPDSFFKHLEQARLNNVAKPILAEIPNFTFDLDQPADFQSLPLQLQQALIADYS